MSTDIKAQNEKALASVKAIYDAAERAEAAADEANTVLNGMKLAAEQADTTLEGIYQDAVDAQTQADKAYGYATSAYNQLGDIEKVVNVLEWASSHGTYSLTEDVTIQTDKYYFTKNGDAYEVVTDPTGNPSTQGWYELSGVDEAITHYVATHLALTNEGLFVQIDNSSSRIQITGSGMYLWSSSGVIAQYTDEVVLGNTSDAHIVLSPTNGLEFYQASTKVAWITANTLQNTLHIEQAEIESSLRIGKFKWVVQSTNRVSLVYSNN